ncbi:hypothetical protein M885DRAFT_536967, partial [Pelagophyceae sp. CCMP2097]
MALRLLGIVLGVVLCGSGFADPRLTGVLADPNGKGGVFRSSSCWRSFSSGSSEFAGRPMGDQDAARAVDSLSGHHGRLLC